MVRILHTLARGLSTSTLKQVGLLCQRLHAHAVDSSVCSLEANAGRKSLFPVLENRLTYCPQSGRLDPTFIHRYGRHVRRLDPHIVHYWGESLDAMVLISNRLYAPRGPMIANLGSGVPSSPNMVRFAQRYFGEKLHFVVGTASEYSTLQRQGISTDRLSRVATGIEPAAEPVTVPALHAELGLSSHHKFLLAMGDLHPQHRFKDLIWALDLLRVMHPDVHLLIVGEGPDEARLGAFAEEIGLQEMVHFRGHVEDPSALMSQCVCLWHPSPLDCPGPTLEAMAAELPLVAAHAPGHEDAIRHGETGFLVPVGDCAEFARKTSVLLKDAALRQRLAQASSRLVVSQFSASEMTSQFHALYQRMDPTFECTMDG